MKNKNSSVAMTSTKPEQELLKALLAVHDSGEAERFLKDLCTPKELTDLAARWWTARLLDEDKHSYRAIHKITGVSVTTVGRVARFLQQENYQGYRLVLDRLKKNPKARR